MASKSGSDAGMELSDMGGSSGELFGISKTKLAEAAVADSYISPDAGSMSEVILYLGTQLSVQSGGCFYCG